MNRNASSLVFFSGLWVLAMLLGAVVVFFAGAITARVSLASGLYLMGTAVLAAVSSLVSYFFLKSIADIAHVMAPDADDPEPSPPKKPPARAASDKLPWES